MQSEKGPFTGLFHFRRYFCSDGLFCGEGFRERWFFCGGASGVAGFEPGLCRGAGSVAVHHTAPSGLPGAGRPPGAGPELARSIRWIDKRRAQTAGPLNPRSACRHRRVQAQPPTPHPGTDLSIAGWPRPAVMQAEAGRTLWPRLARISHEALFEPTLLRGSVGGDGSGLCLNPPRIRP